jgi:hypothetical protein
MDSLLWFVATLALLVAVVRWIHRHLHGVAYLLTGSPDTALVLYALPLLPGVLLHELSHALMAFVLRVRTAGLTVLPRRDPHGHVALGSVMIEQVDVVRASLIGVAPLLFGCGAILLIGQRVFGVSELGSVLLAGEGPAISEALGRLFQTPDAALWMYLIFAISNAMLPSASDRETWPPVILFVVGVFVLVLITDQGVILQAMADSVSAGVTWLTAAFIITLAINLPVMLLIALLERGGESVFGRRVYYYKPGEDAPPRRRK